MTDGVRVVALDEQGRVALVEDDFYLQGRRMVHLPGGGCEGQAPLDAATRELAEETGLASANLQMLGIIDPLPAITSARTSLVLATDLRHGQVRRDATEVGMTMQWLPLCDAVEAVVTGEISESGSVAGLLLAERRLGQRRR
ncbi:NUDIX hydrolase [Streptomyces sp. P38-E01]|uniref:NUDIX hydrolase n=1 Tax=Streptomyces tardus TaxID=2780544 RepID=A0A949JG78_9ACTN|nr:NUDIX hydrolase [Streptomyces tardus]